MDYTNPAKKVIADGKRAFAAIEVTHYCPSCAFRRTKKLSRLTKADLYCPTCKTQLKREKLFGS